MKKFSFRVDPFAPAGLFLLFFSWEPAARAAVVASVMAHELSHLAAAKICGERVESARLTAFGISLGFSPPHSYGEEAFVAAAGPAASFALALLGRARGGAFGSEVFVFSLFLGLLNLFNGIFLDVSHLSCVAQGKSYDCVVSNNRVWLYTFKLLVVKVLNVFCR